MLLADASELIQRWYIFVDFDKEAILLCGGYRTAHANPVHFAITSTFVDFRISSTFSHRLEP